MANMLRASSILQCLAVFDESLASVPPISSEKLRFMCVGRETAECAEHARDTIPQFATLFRVVALRLIRF